VRTHLAVEWLTRAMTLFDRNRNTEAEGAFNSTLAAPGLNADLECRARYHLAQTVWKQRQRPRAAPLFDAAEGACRRPESADLHAKALYQGARSWAAAGDRAAAESRYARVEAEHTDHTYADDARLRMAELAEDAGESENAAKLLAEIPTRPSSDLRTGTLRRADLEAYGSLLAGLRPCRSVLVTGEAPGRREAAAGLAATAAAAGERTVLLECELAEPGLAEALGLAVAPGLHEYLRGTAESEAILKPVVLAGPGSAGAREPIVCVVAGRPTDDGASLLGSERFRHAASSLSGAYELLVIDGPPPGREAELLAAMAVAEVTLAWSERGAPLPDLPAPAAGLVVGG